jgi:hypothetical protein
MINGRRSSLVAGVLLILLGALLLILRLVPGFQAVVPTWPLIIVGVGLFLLVMALLTKTPGLAIPACIVGGIGTLLYWQAVTGNWGSWAFAWTLIPGFVGAGLLVAGLLGENPSETVKAGAIMVIISIGLFVVFGSLMGGFRLLGRFWPVILIAGGVLVLIAQGISWLSGRDRNTV